MKDKIPKELLSNAYRRELWKNTEVVLKKIKKALPIKELHVMGSFTSKKRRPADVDFIVLLKTSSSKIPWSVDLVIAPANEHGEEVHKDAKLWLKQKYGAKGVGMIRLK